MKKIGGFITAIAITGVIGTGLIVTNSVFAAEVMGKDAANENIPIATQEADAADGQNLLVEEETTAVADPKIVSGAALDAAIPQEADKEKDFTLTDGNEKEISSRIFSDSEKDLVLRIAINELFSSAPEGTLINADYLDNPGGSVLELIAESDGKTKTFAIFTKPDGSIIRKIEITGSNEEILKRSDAEGEPEFVEGEPAPGDLSEEAATKKARDTIVKKYALTAETLAKFDIERRLDVYDPNAKVWYIYFFPRNEGDFQKIGSYYVGVNAKTGKITKIMTAADGVG